MQYDFFNIILTTVTDFMSAALVQSVYVNPLVLLTWWSNFISMKWIYYIIFFFNLFLYFLEQNFKKQQPNPIYQSDLYKKHKYNSSAGVFSTTVRKGCQVVKHLLFDPFI